jgi:hypothetical protein
MYAISIGFAIGCRGEPERAGYAASPTSRRRWVLALERLGHQSIRAIAMLVASFADRADMESSWADGDVDIHGVEDESDLETSRGASSRRKHVRSPANSDHRANVAPAH